MYITRLNKPQTLTLIASGDGVSRSAVSHSRRSQTCAPGSSEWRCICTDQLLELYENFSNSDGYLADVGGDFDALPPQPYFHGLMLLLIADLAGVARQTSLRMALATELLASACFAATGWNNVKGCVRGGESDHGDTNALLAAFSRFMADSQLWTDPETSAAYIAQVRPELLLHRAHHATERWLRSGFSEASRNALLQAIQACSALTLEACWTVLLPEGARASDRILGLLDVASALSAMYSASYLYEQSRGVILRAGYSETQTAEELQRLASQMRFVVVQYGAQAKVAVSAPELRDCDPDCIRQFIDIVMERIDRIIRFDLAMYIVESVEPRSA